MAIEANRPKAETEVIKTVIFGISFRLPKNPPIFWGLFSTYTPPRLVSADIFLQKFFQRLF